MRPIAFLTLPDLKGYLGDDELAVAPFAERGFQVEFVPWQEHEGSWSRFEAVLIRSTWNYQSHLPEFLAVLGEIERQTLLVNSFPLVQWNIKKTYLEVLSRAGVDTVPTLWGGASQPPDLAASFAQLGTDDIVLKPTVGASAFDTFRILKDPNAASPASDTVPDATSDNATEDALFSGAPPILSASKSTLDRVATTFADREHMIQPFVPEILEAGEYSLFFFGGKFSHAVRKVPSAGDFRVQAEYGGRFTAFDATPGWIGAGQKVLQKLKTLVDAPPLYARIDLVPQGEKYLLMELELIEPSLYFSIVDRSVENFADAVAALLAAT